MRSFLFLFFLLILACSSDRSAEEVLSKSSSKRFTKKTCVDESCAKVDLHWPEFGSNEVGNRVNLAIQNQMLSYFYGDSSAKSFEEQASIYLQDFEKTKAEFPDMPGDWEMEIKAEVSFDSLNTLSIQFTEFNYSGGAHPNSSSYFMNFDRKTGEYLPIDRLILDQAKLLSLAEKAFREYHSVPDSVSLESDGRFFLPETGFFLPNAMGFNGEEFLLIYNPYEIGPYSMGFTELNFSLEELDGILRK